MIRSLLTVALFAAVMAPTFALQSGYGTPPKPGSGGAPPAWRRLVKLTDGRTFITDGGMTLDVAFAKPATLPTDVTGAGVAKVIEGYLAAQPPNEVALNGLVRTPGAHYGGPAGVVLNAGYVDYLRALFPAGRVSLRMKTDLDPVVIVLDGKPVGLVMPMRSGS